MGRLFISAGPGQLRGLQRPDGTMDLSSLYHVGERSWVGRAPEAPCANDDIFGEPILWLDQAEFSPSS